MKIFNWMQRKLNQNVIKDGLARNVKKTESIAIDTNTKALLEQVALVDVLDGWKDGILTIGTFGFDPLIPENEETEHVTLENEAEGLEFACENNEDDDEDVENEDENPLIFTTFQHNFEYTSSGNLICDEIEDAVLEMDQAKNKKRTTLAELFYEDSDTMKKKQIPNELESNPNDKKEASLQNKKNGRSFAKKLIPHVGEDSRPVKKLNKLMRKMLKRKIHPELDGGKVTKSEAQGKTTILELLASKPNEQHVPFSA